MRSQEDDLGRRRPGAGVDRLPPHDDLSEQAVLGAILLAPSDTMALCISRIKDPEVFYNLAHQEIYRVLVMMHDAQEPIDEITLKTWLELQNLLEDIGGTAYVFSLRDKCVSAANVEYYLENVIGKFRARKAIATATEMVSRVYDNAGEIDALISSATQGLMDLSQAQIDAEDTPIRDLVQESLAEMEAWMTNRGEVSGLSTGLADLDRMTTGLHGGEMIVIAARPGSGKTSLGMNIVEHVACDLRLPVGVFSLEMTDRSLVTRMICSRARVNLRQLRDGFLAQRDMPRITSAAGSIASAQIHINDIAGLSILGLRTRARRMQQQYGIRLFVIDYLQLLSAERSKNDNRQQEVASISNGIKALAKELNVPVIVMSQLNRGPEKEKNRRPQLSDLRESGAIEQDADLVGMLFRPAFDPTEEQTSDDSEPITLYVAKQRNGPTGDIALTFMKTYTRFESVGRVSSDDVPAPEEQLPLPEAQDTQRQFPD